MRRQESPLLTLGAALKLTGKRPPVNLDGAAAFRID